MEWTDTLRGRVRRRPYSMQHHFLTSCLRLSRMLSFLALFLLTRRDKSSAMNPFKLPMKRPVTPPEKVRFPTRTKD